MTWMRLNSPYRQNKLNGLVFLTLNELNRLAYDALTGSLSDAFQKEWPEWANGLIYYPFDLVSNLKAYNLHMGKNTNIHSTCRVIDEVDLNMGFTLGEYKHIPIGDFTDFEPYTQIEVYLPYYGQVSLKVADIYNKYVQFRLFIDFYSGQGTYYIGVSDESSEPHSLRVPWRAGLSDIDGNTRILGTYTCQLGYSIPYGQSGASEAIRNITLGLVKGAATIGGAAIAGAIGAGVASTVSSTVVDYSSTARTRNPQTGRQVIRGSVSRHEETTNTESVTRNTWKGDVVSGCFNTAVNAIANANISPQFDRANNPFSDSIGPRSIYVIEKRVNIKDVDSEYSHLYGRPLGETRTLSSVHGYTECSAVHFEGENFGSATSEELKLITQFMSSGVILP